MDDDVMVLCDGKERKGMSCYAMVVSQYIKGEEDDKN